MPLHGIPPLRGDNEWINLDRENPRLPTPQNPPSGTEWAGQHLDCEGKVEEICNEGGAFPLKQDIQRECVQMNPRSPAQIARELCFPFAPMPELSPEPSPKKNKTPDSQRNMLNHWDIVGGLAIVAVVAIGVGLATGGTGSLPAGAATAKVVFGAGAAAAGVALFFSNSASEKNSI